MKIYLDSNFRVHTVYSDGYIEADVDFFDGKCPSMIEAYQFIPYGMTWIRADGEVFSGEMISMIESDYPIADVLEQYDYSMENMVPLEEVADLVELIYESDLEVIG